MIAARNKVRQAHNDALRQAVETMGMVYGFIMAINEFMGVDDCKGARGLMNVEWSCLDTMRVQDRAWVETMLTAVATDICRVSTAALTIMLANDGMEVPGWWAATLEAAAFVLEGKPWEQAEAAGTGAGGQDG